MAWINKLTIYGSVSWNEEPGNEIYSSVDNLKDPDTINKNISKCIKIVGKFHFFQSTLSDLEIMEIFITFDWHLIQRKEF